ncbi:MAG: hypothetical protein ACLRHO_05740 [Ruminococcus sp.]
MKTIKELVLSAKNGNKKKHLISCINLQAMMYGSLAFLCSKTKKTQKT